MALAEPSNTADSWPEAQCSVVVPACNVAPWIEETIESVRAQSLNGWELIVVDDGSTDDTAKRLEAIADTRLRVIHQSNHGVAHARNRGVSAASAPFIVFLDGDDRLAPGALERLLRAFDTHPEIIAAYGEAIAVDEIGQPIGTGAKPFFNRRPSGDVLGALAAKNFILTGAIAVRRDALAESGGFREDLAMAEDWELWCRLATLGPFHYIGGAPILEYRLRPASAVRTTGLNAANALASIEAVFANPAVIEQLGPARAAQLRRRATAAAHSFPANQHLRAHHWNHARNALLAALRHDPLRPREWILLACAILHWLPPQVARHLK